MSQEKTELFNKYASQISKAFEYTKQDLLRNVAVLVKNDKEVPRSVKVTFTINLEDIIDVETKEIKDEN